MAQPDRGAAAIARGEQPGGGLERRRFEVAGLAVELRQDMRGSGALRPLDDDRVWADGGGEIPPILTGGLPPAWEAAAARLIRLLAEMDAVLMR